MLKLRWTHPWIALCLTSCGTGIDTNQSTPLSSPSNSPFIQATCTSDGLPCASHRIFLTSTVDNGAFTSHGGGLTGADAFCQNAATSAGLTRTYKAVMSSSTVNAKDRLIFTGPTYNFQTASTFVVVANQGSDLWATAGTPLQNAVGYTETFTNPSSQRPWTGTNGTGVFQGNSCNDWTGGGSGAQGANDATSVFWLFAQGTPCGSNKPVFCVSQ